MNEGEWKGILQMVLCVFSGVVESYDRKFA
jgi:hypothetical protein